MSSMDTPPSFPPSSDSGGEEGDVPARENPQVLWPRKRYLSGNGVTAERTCGQTRHAQSPSARTRDGAHSELMAATTELNNFDEALLTKAAGVIFEVVIEPEIQWEACDDFDLAAKTTLHPGEPD